MQKLHE
jgi:hypothetical protein